MDSFLGISKNLDFSLKNNIPNRNIFPDISNYAHLVDGRNNLIAGSVERQHMDVNIHVHIVQYQSHLTVVSRHSVLKKL